MEESPMVGEDADGDIQRDHQYPRAQKFWRSVSWSSHSAPSTPGPANYGKLQPFGQTTMQGPPLTPRSQQSSKARSCLPPLQPLSITRRCLEEWPQAGSDDIGEWPYCTTPGGKRDAGKQLNGPDIKLDLGSVQRPTEPPEIQVKRDKLAFFDKDCSRVAEHIYLGSDAVAKNREVLRENGITHVLNCVGFVCPEYFKTDLVYKTLWLQDNPSEDITSILYDVFDYFEEVREQGGRVLVHCCQGVSRSTSLVIAYLMWREGQSFEDAFQYVKAARGITNPNIGFASQLSQCQKRVHAAPMSPSSLLRMYRMAPHSSYAPLHLVPKSVNPPGPSALDSRGAFIVHIPSAIYVWIGGSCHHVMISMAKAAASQVVRYERAQGPPVVMREGHETDEFWDALSKAPHLLDEHEKSEKGTVKNMLECQVDVTHNVGVGNKRVESYNIDFELFGRAIAGGVVPPFSSSGEEIETHLPARENGWDILRRKFVTGNVKDFVTASKATSDTPDSSSVKSSVSPYHSPASRISDFRISSKSCSPSFSPLSFTSSPNSSVWSSFSSSPSPSPVSNLWEPLETIAEPVSFPSKGPASSLAQRRGSNSPSLQLPRLFGVSGGLLGVPWSPSVSPKGKSNKGGGVDDFQFKSFDGAHRGMDIQKQEKHSEQNDSAQNKDIWLDEKCQGRDQLHNLILQASSPSIQMADVSSEDESSSLAKWEEEEGQKWMHPMLYKWPEMEKIDIFDANILDHRELFVLLAPNTANQNLKFSMVVYLWVGSDLVMDSSSIGKAQVDGRICGIQTTDRDWEQIGHEFLKRMDLPRDTSIRVCTSFSKCT
uniref:Protein-tyrosine-phosphatase n=1 Tax=Araucaria cunninghamii TaxID=56994 RepID=A0A0D6R0N6_ARACU